MATTQEPIGTLNAPPPAAPRSLWRNRDYMLLWSGQTISSVGTGVSGLAFPLLILYVLHGNDVQAGITFALRAFPYLIFSLPAGALIDRWNRKLVMIACDTGRALALGSMPLAAAFGRLSIGQIYIVALIEGSLFVFFNIAEAACLPRVVPKSQLPAATGQNGATDALAGIISQPLSGGIFAINQMLPFVGDAISYVVSVVSLLFIKSRFQNERTVEQRHLLVEIREGLSWLWHQRLIRYIAFLTGSANFVFGGIVLVQIELARHLHASTFAIGLIGGIAAIGGIIGSIMGAGIQRRFSFGQVIIGVLIIQAIFWPLLIFAPNIYVIGVISGVIFMVGPIYNVVQFSYRSALIPDRLQGRVNSAFRLLAFGFQPLGGFMTGLLLQGFGTTVTILFFWAVFLGSAVITTFNPLVRDAKPISQIADEVR